MPSKKAQISLRLDDDVNYKIKYIADDNFRPVNSEITMLVLAHIAEYEMKHGEIKVPTDLKRRD